ncbi:hypothetical protein BDW22DRAFT_1371326, partial [Trametopsis cervina]
MKPVSCPVSPHTNASHCYTVRFTAESNARGYSFDVGNSDLMENILEYHTAPGFRYQPGTVDMHTLVTTALPSGVGPFQAPQKIILNCTANATNPAVIQILNQNIRPDVIYNDTITLGSTTFYIIDAVLGFPRDYNWEVQHTQVLRQWQALEVASGGIDLELQSSIGVTVFAPSDDAWAISKFVNETRPQDLLRIYSNHVIFNSTIWSQDFTTGVHTSASGLNYSFTLTSSGQYIVYLNGTSANITSSDILTDNGVIHLLDAPLWKSSFGTEISTGTPSAPQPAPTSSSGKTGIAYLGQICIRSAYPCKWCISRHLICT